jgi:hypothetical protein
MSSRAWGIQRISYAASHPLAHWSPPAPNGGWGRKSMPPPLPRLPAPPGCPEAPQRARCIEPRPELDPWMRRVGRVAERHLLCPEARRHPPQQWQTWPGAFPCVELRCYQQSQICVAVRTRRIGRRGHTNRSQAQVGQLRPRLRGGGYRATGRPPQNPTVRCPPAQFSPSNVPGGTKHYTPACRAPSGCRRGRTRARVWLPSLPAKKV